MPDMNHVAEVKVKVVPDFTDFDAEVEKRLSVRTPANDPLAQAILSNIYADTFMGAMVGDQMFRLERWQLEKIPGAADHHLVTFWESEDRLEKVWRIPWRKRFRLLLDRVWWRATGWI